MNFSSSEIFQKFVEGTRASAHAAAEKARQHGTPLVVWKNGSIQLITPDEFLHSTSGHKAN